MLKVMTIVGTRPEIIRLARVIAKLDTHCQHLLVHTGQNYDYELNQIFFDQLRIRKPDRFLSAAGETAAETIGKIIIEVDKALAETQPDAVLILGDTNSALSAIPAKRRKIPIFHMEAGNRCFDLRVPEEINRRIVDHIADINLTYSQIARQYLLREGLPPDQIIWTGSPMREVLEYYVEDIAASQILKDMSLSHGQYYVVSAHREENVDSDERLHQLFKVMAHLSCNGVPVIVSTHPRTRRRIEALGPHANSAVQFCKPFGFFDYIKLQQSAKAVLSDSGTITEESSILGFPALNIRDVHERPEGFQEAAVMMTGLDMQRIIPALDILDAQRGTESYKQMRLVEDYASTNVSEKILRILLSYTDFVNQRVWRKS